MEKTDRQFIEKRSFFNGFAILLMVFGLLGIMIGLWSHFNRAASPGELILNKALILYSVGLIFSSNIHFQAFRTIKRLSEKKDAG